MLKFCITIAATLFLLSSSGFAQDRVRLTNGEWPPFLGKDLPGHGFASQIVSEAFAEVGIKVEYGFFPWKRAYVLAKEGEWDGTVVWSKSPERLEKFFYSDPVILTEEVLFHKTTSKIQWDSYDDLKGLTVGGATGYFYGDAFHEAAEKGLFNFEVYGTDLTNFEKLLLGRIDLFVVEKSVGLSVIQSSFPPEDQAKLTYHPHAVRQDHHHLILTKAVPRMEQVIIRFNEGLKRLRERGRIAEIMPGS